jgi:hypothetical protein
MKIKYPVIRPTLLAALGFSLALAPSLKAIPVTVQEVRTAPFENVWINVTGFYSGKTHAGVIQLLLNGTATDGFCIDPFHFGLGGPQPYQMVPLTSAPKNDHLTPGAHMTAGEAATISELWALAYPLIGSDPVKAAALQIAIWEVIGGNQFSLTSAQDYGASLLLTTVEAPNYHGPKANLIALTGPGQDFVIPDPSPPKPAPTPVPQSVPDHGATLILFGLALAALALVNLANADHQRPTHLR